MKSKVFQWALPIAAVLVLALGTGAQAQPPDHMKFRGIINDFTPASTGGPWEVRGHWSLVVKGKYGRADCKADFSAALTMERSDLGVVQNGGGDLNNPTDRNAHTHHITLSNAEVTEIPGGIEVTGPATITANGVFPPPFGPDLPTLTIDITGGSGENSVTFSNVTLLFGDPGAGHFGANPLHGVVVRTSDKGRAAGH
jgi:hypothetical protein